MTDRLIILGVSLDSVNGKIRLTVQGIRPESFIASSSNVAPSSENKSAFTLLSADADSVQEAIEQIDQLTPRFLYFGHNAVFFIGEDLAKKGIMPYLDFFARNQWGQESAWIVIAKGESGQKLLETTNLLVKYPSLGLEEMVRKHETGIPTLFKFLLNYHATSDCQVLADAMDWLNTPAPPGYQIHQLLLSTSAIFHKDKLIGYLDDPDSQSYDWLKNGFVNARFSFNQTPDPSSPLVGVMLSGEPASFQVTKTPNLGIKITVNCDFFLTETSSVKVSNQKEIRELQNRLDEALTQRFDQLLTHLQAKKVDVFNIAEHIHAYQNQTWQEIKGQWPDIYSQMPKEIIVNTHYRNSSVMVKYPGF